MPNKRYSFLIEKSALTAQVEADQEGNARFMVRLTIPNRLVRVRIGYLTGARRTWCAELFERPARSIPANSAKAACRLLLDEAVKQPGIQQYLKT